MQRQKKTDGNIVRFWIENKFYTQKKLIKLKY